MVVVGFAAYNCLYACANSEVHMKWKYGEAEILWRQARGLTVFSTLNFESLIRHPRPLQTELRTCSHC